ncbi:MAG: DsbA family protein [Candidatus Pacebacteria bacterium]|nr:DsbA family protein [Candidatus Paceibacterota bacterium]MBP9866903.1 DsbA family protein [Candidatus Paceibacterota bacterium]
MKEHITPHGHSNHTVTEHYQEEGAITHESIDASRHEAHAYPSHRSKGFTLSTPLAIIIASMIIAGGLMGYGFITSNAQPAVVRKAFAGKTIDSSDYITGKQNSKVMVVEYSDPECPYCIQLSPTLKKLQADYGDKVGFVYRHFPLTQIHKNAFDESRAIACAGKIGGSSKYYEYINALYDYKMSKQSATLPSTGKEDFARTIGLDQTAFATCMKEKQTEQEVTNSIDEGVRAGVQGTPATFVLLKTKKGYDVVSMVDGARPEEFFKAVIDEALGAK